MGVILYVCMYVPMDMYLDFSEPGRRWGNARSAIGSKLIWLLLSTCSIYPVDSGCSGETNMTKLNKVYIDNRNMWSKPNIEPGRKQHSLLSTCKPLWFVVYIKVCAFCCRVEGVWRYRLRRQSPSPCFNSRKSRILDLTNLHWLKALSKATLNTECEITNLFSISPIQ